MAVVVKEASKTPLAIAALADNMAKTYLQYAQNETSQAQWEQEATWRNQDREYENQQKEKLGQLASNVSSMDSSAFLNPAAQESAAYAAGQGQDWTDYLASAGGEDTSLSSHYLRLKLTEERAQRLAGLLPADPIKDATWEAMYGGIKTAKDGTGMDTHIYDPITGQVLAEMGKGYAPNAWAHLMNGGNGSTAVGTPEGTGAMPSYASEAEARAARSRGDISVGQTILINGKQYTVDPF